MSPSLPTTTQSRAFQPPRTHQQALHDEEDQDCASAEAPVRHVAVSPEETDHVDIVDGLGRSSSNTESSSSSPHESQAQASPSSRHRRIAVAVPGGDVHADDDLETHQATAVAAAALHANLPAWAVAALQETLEQPWKVHFSGSDPDHHPDFAQGEDTVPFYDGRLKVCYGEGSMAA